MSVILNGGLYTGTVSLGRMVSLVDVCDTEWRVHQLQQRCITSLVSLVDVCDTEWRKVGKAKDKKLAQVSLVDACVTEWRSRRLLPPSRLQKCHSLMPVEHFSQIMKK